MEKKNNKKIILIVSCIVVVALIIGVSIAYFSSRATSSEKTITTAKLSISYENESVFNLDNIIPLQESEIQASATRINFTVTNNENTDSYIQIDIADITTDKLQDYDFKWALYNITTSGAVKLTTGSFVGIEDNKVTLASGKKLEANQSENYRIYIWIEETNEDQERLVNGTFKGKVQITGYTKDKTLVNKILTDNTVNTIPYFTAIANSDRRLYVQKADSTKSNFGFPTYYFRGSVENNYVQLGTYKSDVTNQIYSDNWNNNVVAHTGDPILWRIVRINEDGSIRLIAQNNINASQIWNSSSNADYEGTEIQTTVNDWYDTTIGVDSKIDKLVQKESFCNDTSDNYNAVTKRLVNNIKPIFTCPNSSDVINEKVGLITADEMVYAGALSNDPVLYNTTYISNDTLFWTISPFANNSIFYWKIGYDYIEGASTIGSGDLQKAARPVINLKGNVTVSGGDGTKANPYIIQ